MTANQSQQQQQQLQQQQEEPNTVPEIDSATHIVVEHHRTGTVKTHVFSSKDGKPSLLGHEIPDTNHSLRESFEAGLDDKMKALKSLVKDSLEQTTMASLDKVDSLRLAVVQSEHRLAEQVSLVTSSAIEQQIKTNVVPKLDSIERILLANSNTSNGGSNGSKKGGYSARSGPASPKSDLSQASMEPMDRRMPQDLGQPGEKAEVEEAEAEVEANGDDHLRNATETERKVLEKLSTIESQVDALCKVVIDGEIPQQDDALLDPEIAARVDNMCEKLLSVPDGAKQSTPESSSSTTATPASDKLDELIQLVTKNQELQEIAAVAATEHSMRQEQTRKEDDEIWQTSLREMLVSHQGELRGLDAHLFALENGFRAMEDGFQDWTKTHRMTLNVYLKYMYMVFKSTKGVENSIQSALVDVRAQAMMEPERRLQFSNDLNDIRTEVSAVFNTLPETIASAIKNSQEPVVVEGEAIAENQAFQDRCAPGANATEFAPDADSPQSDSEPPVEEEPKPDPVMEKLVSTVETLQASIASMVEKYGELANLVAPLPRPPTPPSRDSEEPAVADDPEVPEPPPREPTVEERLKAVEKRLAAGKATSDAPASSEPAASTHAEAPLPTLPVSRAGNPNPGPSPGYLGRSASVVAAATEAVDAAVPLAADSSMEEVIDEPVEVTAASLPTAPPGPNFMEELEAMNRSLTDLLNVVNEGQNSLHHEMQREFQRVIHTINPPETEEDRVRRREAENRARLEEIESTRIRALEAERFKNAEDERIKEEEKQKQGEEAAAQKAAEERSLALERISMIPNLMNSLEGVNYHLGTKSDELMKEVSDGLGDLKIGTAAVEEQVAACLNKVQLVVDGSIQDSSVLNEIKYQVGEFGAKLEESIKTCCDDDVLKAQVAEAIKKTKDVTAMVEDVKKISEKSLTVQEELQKQLGEWHQKQDEGIEALAKKHGESWEAWYKKHEEEWTAWRQTHGDSLVSLISLHDRQDRTLHDWGESRREHREQLQEWHRTHDGRLEELEKRHCHCCSPDPVEDPTADTVDDPAADPNAPVEFDDKSIKTDGPATRPPTIHCCGGDAGDTDPCTRRMRELLEEFLQRILPGYNPDCVTFESHSTSGVIVPEPRGLNGEGIEEEGDPSEERPTSPGLTFTTRATSGIIVPEPGLPMSGAAGSYHTGTIPRGEAADYHGAAGLATEGVDVTAAHFATAAPSANGSVRSSPRQLPPPPGQDALPQELYDLLRPYFYSDVSASAAASSGSESVVVAALRKELAKLQEKFETVHQESLDNEGSVDRLMTTALEKNRELDELKADRAQIIQDFEARQSEWGSEATSYQQELAKTRSDLENVRQENLRLYRLGLGLNPDLDMSTPGPAAEAGEEGDDLYGSSENEDGSSSPSSPLPERLPLAGLMTEASENLRQALDEIKQQKSILYKEITDLEAKKDHLEVQRDHLAEEVTRMERQCFELSVAAVTQSRQRTAPAIPEQENREPVDDDHDDNYVTEDDGGHAGDGGRSSRSGRSGNGGSVTTNSSRLGGGSGSNGTVRSSRQQRRQSVYSRAQSRGRQSAYDFSLQQERVPQLEADVRICKDGVMSETVLSSKTVLTDEQYERIRSSRAEAGVEHSSDDVWSLSFDVRVKMVQNS
ncbi:hypothetical protein BGX33_003694 [Mortierella sp. NVP41]|nr:hypothetical protein BGX33_003694 [Mortierella sp. NVP41]